MEYVGVIAVLNDCFDCTTNGDHLRCWQRCENYKSRLLPHRSANASWLQHLSLEIETNEIKMIDLFISLAVGRQSIARLYAP